MSFASHQINIVEVPNDKHTIQLTTPLATIVGGIIKDATARRTPRHQPREQIRVLEQLTAVLLGFGGKE